MCPKQDQPPTNLSREQFREAMRIGFSWTLERLRPLLESYIKKGLDASVGNQKGFSVEFFDTMRLLIRYGDPDFTLDENLEHLRATQSAVGN